MSIILCNDRFYSCKDFSYCFLNLRFDYVCSYQTRKICTFCVPISDLEKKGYYIKEVNEDAPYVIISDGNKEYFEWLCSVEYTIKNGCIYFQNYNAILRYKIMDYYFNSWDDFYMFVKNKLYNYLYSDYFLKNFSKGVIKNFDLRGYFYCPESSHRYSCIVRRIYTDIRCSHYSHTLFFNGLNKIKNILGG